MNTDNEPHPALSAEEVAVSAGVSSEEFEAIVASGFVVPDVSGLYLASDVARARLVMSLNRSGIPLDDLAAAVAEQRLSLDYVDQLMPEPVVLVEAGDDDRDVLQWGDPLAPILGTSPSPDGVVRSDDLRLYRIMARAIEIGIPAEQVIRIARNFAQAASRLANMQREFVDEVLLSPAIEATGSPLTALEVTAATRYEYRRLGRAVLIELMDRQMDDAIFRNLVQLTEFALAQGGVEASHAHDGVGFIDIGSYSRLSEEQGDDVAAVQASRLTDLIQDLARDQGARLVKSLGDGALVHGDTVRRVIEVALEAVETSEERGIWPVHAGVNMGRVVQRDGDLFGTTVNIASRIANEAQPGQVVGTQSVVDAIESDEDYQVTSAGRTTLKNISRPVELFLIRRR